MSEETKTPESPTESATVATAADIVKNLISPLKPSIDNRVVGAITVDSLIDKVASERADVEIAKRTKTGMNAIETYESLRKVSNNIRPDVVVYNDKDEKIENWSKQQLDHRKKVREALANLEKQLTIACTETDPEKSKKAWDEQLPNAINTAAALITKKADGGK